MGRAAAAAAGAGADGQPEAVSRRSAVERLRDWTAEHRPDLADSAQAFGVLRLTRWAYWERLTIPGRTTSSGLVSRPASTDRRRST
jgi:hypothetical protein